MEMSRLHWDRFKDRWGYGGEAYYLHDGSKRLGRVARSAGPPISLKISWSAGYFRDDGEPRWIGDYATKEAAMQAVEAVVVPADGEARNHSVLG